MGDTCISEALTSHPEGHLLAGRLARPWHQSWENLCLLGGFSGYMLPSVPYHQTVYVFVAASGLVLVL